VHLPAVGLPRLGALGAGLASSIASLLLAAIVLGAAREFRDDREGEPIPMRTILRLGVPAGLQILAEIAVYVLISMVVGSLGATVTSAHQIALNVTNLAFVAALGVSSATAVRVGRAIGAGESPRRAGLVGITLGAVIMSVCALILALFPRALAALFIDDPAVIALSVKLLLIAAVFQIFDGIQAIAGGALNGAGDMRFAFLASLACHWLVGFPIALFLGFAMKLGVTGMWWGLTAGLITVSAVLSMRFVWLSSKPIMRV
jgi:MATE family multidrug resistance protein